MDEKLRSEMNEIIRIEVKKALEEERRHLQRERELERQLSAEQKGQFSKTAFCITAFFAAALLTQIIGAVLLSFLGENLTGKLWNDDRFLLLFSSFTMYLAAFPVSALLFRLIPLRPCRERKALSSQSLILIFIISMGVGFAGNLLGQGTEQLFGLETSGDIPPQLLSGSGMTLNMLVTVFAAPVVEELLFRKYLIDRIGAYGEKTAVLVSGLLFGLSHGNAGQFFYTFGIGVIWAYVYCRTGNIGLPIAFHMLFNLVGGIWPAELYKGVELIVDPASPLWILNRLTGLELGTMWQELCRHLSIANLFFNFACMVGTAVIVFSERKKIRFRPGDRPIWPGRTVSTVFLNPGMAVFLIFSAWNFWLGL